MQSNSKKILFEVKNLEQTYLDRNFKTDKILKIDNLNIPENEFTVILGSSGSGKTTLLEILGGINRKSKGKIIYKPGRIDLDYDNLWQDEKLHTDFLRNRVSFAFQQANLIPYFNITENIAIPRIISENISLKQATEDIDNDNILLTLNLESIKVKNIEKTSGGQQQRAAMARAANSNYEVMFSDEPTGNLGVHHEDLIFSYLRNLVDAQNKSVIVVTHDIEKALEYADNIVLISFEDNRGIIKNHNFIPINRSANRCYIRGSEFSLKQKLHDSQNNTVKVLNKFVIDKIKNIMCIAASPKIIAFPKTEQTRNSGSQEREKNRKINLFSGVITGLETLAEPVLKKFNHFLEILVKILSLKLLFSLYHKFDKKTDNNFIKIFFSKDYPNYFNNRVLSFFVVIFLSLLAISFFNAWNQILTDRLNNPFVNVLLAKNNSTKSFEEIKSELLTTKMQQKYAIKDVFLTQAISLQFYDYRGNDYSYISGRTIAADDPLLQQLNKNSADMADSKEISGVYITEKLLKKLNYPLDSDYININVGAQKQLIKIAGVFKFLPGDTFLLTNHFYGLLSGGGLYYQSLDFVQLVAIRDNTNFKNRFAKFLKAQNIKVSTIIESSNKAIKYKFYKNFQKKQIESMVKKFKQKYPEFRNINIYYPPNEDMVYENAEIEYSAWFFIHRDGLKNSQALKTELAGKNYKIDLEKISTQKDFLMISNILKAAIIFLSFLAFISTLIYIKYSFYLHIYQRRREIGILKSLGVYNETFNNLYHLELFVFFSSVFFISAIIIVILQAGNLLLLNFTHLENLLLNLFDWWTLFHILLLFIASQFALGLVLKKILFKPAGDLIYDRNLGDL